jgi:hypothetical protein
VKRIMHAILICGLGLSASTFAAGAATSATAGSHSGRPNGTAGATAEYTGQTGWTRTEAQSGRVNTATGVAVGVDQNGLALSVSNAVAPQNGPALATNFTLSIGRDGQASTSFGVSVANGPVHRQADAGGSAATTRLGSVAVSEAGGRTDRWGTVKAHTVADNRVAPRTVIRAADNRRTLVSAAPTGQYVPRELRRGIR